LRKYEGFSPTAKWDENAYRGGYGTDKKIVNGTLTTASKDTTWSQKEAEDTLEYEIRNDYGPKVANQLGVENWEKLNDKQKAALVSLGYNAGPYIFKVRDYGRGIKQAIENDDLETAGQLIKKGPTTGSSSGKYYSGLAKRRSEESDLFLS
jgi:GH24 family phage-related lysozyme (muramidase)